MVGFSERCTTLAKEGVGVVHVHRWWWRPGRVASMWFQRPGTDTMRLIPEDQWDAAFEAVSTEQFSALLRGSTVTRPVG